MKKRNVATVMAAAMTLTSAVPVLAQVVTGENTSIDVAKANGKKVVVKGYKDIYNTNFTETTKDDVLKPGYEILDVIEAGKADDKTDDRYVVSIAYTEKELTDAVKKEVKTQKENFEDTEVYIQKLVERGYTLKKETTKATLNADGTLKTAPKTTFTLTRGTGSNTESIIVNHEGTVYKKADEATLDSVTLSKKVEVDGKETTASIAQRKEQHRKISKWSYDIRQMSNVEVEKVEFNDEGVSSSYNKHLQLNVYKKAEKKSDRTLVAEYKIRDFENFDNSLYVDVVAKNDFTKHWAEKEIFNAMYAGNIDNSASFRPQDSITRAEFVKILVNSFGVDTKSADKYKNPFSDVKKGSWEEKYVVAAYVAGVVEGDGDGTFRPNAPISRQEAAKMVATLASSQKKTYTVGTTTKVIKGETFDSKGNHVAVTTNFRDDKNIAVWADESILELSSAKVLEGYGDGNFKPENSITRAESIVMMDKAASKLN